MKRGRISHMKLRSKIMLLAVGAQLFIVGVAGLFGLLTINSNNDLLAQTTLGALELVSAKPDERLDKLRHLADSVLVPENCFVYLHCQRSAVYYPRHVKLC